MDSDIADLADLLRDARRAVVFTGAGISTESGIPDFTSVTWFALMAPKGTPDAIIQKLNTTVTDILKDDDVKAKFEKLSYSHQRRHVMAIDAAKTPETRARRIEGALKILREG